MDLNHTEILRMCCRDFQQRASPQQANSPPKGVPPLKRWEVLFPREDGGKQDIARLPQYPPRIVLVCPGSMF